MLTADLITLVLLGIAEIREMIAEGGTEVACQFCGRKYEFAPEELLALTAEHEA